MASPFDDGRVGIIHSDYSIEVPWANIPRWATDVFLPAHDPKTTKAKYDQARADAAIRGTKVQVWFDGTHQAGELTAEAVDFWLSKVPTHTGGVEVNIEADDDLILTQRLQFFYARFRELRPTRELAINIAPYKAAFLPVSVAQDEHAHLRMQTFYGVQMHPADPWQLAVNMETAMPRERTSLCYSAKPRKQIDGTLAYDLPVFADSNLYVKRLRKGSIFNANLLREGGLI